MNQFKFRAWDDKNKKWLLGYEYKNLRGFSLFGETVLMGEWGRVLDMFLFERNGYKNTDLKVMQCTGLRSSDGGCNLPVEDAYFDDIVEFYNTDGKKTIAVIVWDDKLRCIAFKRIEDGFLLNYEMIRNSGYYQPSELQFQIIGNIYETPELLKYETDKI